MKALLQFSPHTLRSTTLIYFVGIILFLSSSHLLTQETDYLQSWVTKGGVSNEIFNNIVSVTNGQNDVFTASSSLNEFGGYDLLISKSDAAGNLIWSDTYSLTTTGVAIAGAIALDNNGDVIITGTAYNNANNFDLILIKYNSVGVGQWNTSYNGAASSQDGGKALFVDNGNNIYVTGSSHENIAHADMLTMRYNASGVQQWVSHYDGNGLDDAGVSISQLNPSVIAIGGPTETSLDHWKYVANQYHVATGTELSSTILNTSGSITGEFTAFTTDDNENVYATVSVKAAGDQYDFEVYKLDSDLQIQWHTTFSGPAGKDDIAKSIGVDDYGNVYISGLSTNSADNKDFLTTKFNSSGSLQWSKLYDGTHDDEATDLIITDDNKVFVTGYTKQGNENIYTALYDENGNELWSNSYNGIYNKADRGTFISLDSNGDILVSGSSEELNETIDLTIKYTKHEIVTPPDNEPLSKSYAYQENRGQLKDTDQNPVPNVKFYSTQKSPALYCQDDKISFVVARLDTALSIPDSMHRVDMSFITSGRSESVVKPIDRKDNYQNYYIGSVEESRENVPSYEKIIYPEIYSGIDLMLSSDNSGTKYYWIVKSGADPADISMVFNGQNGLILLGDDLLVQTSIENIVFPRGNAYQIDLTGNKVSLPWEPDYTITGNEVNFSVGTYNNSLDLVIQIDKDPTPGSIVSTENLEWSTYYGDINDESTTGIVSFSNQDGSGFIYQTGSTMSMDFPTGGFSADVTLGGAMDAFVICFNEQGQRRWATFYGGGVPLDAPNANEANEVSLAVAVNSKNEVYFAGNSQSKDFLQTSPTGGYLDPDANDISSVFGKGFIVKLQGGDFNGGAILWSTLFGDNERSVNGTCGLAINSEDRVFMAGNYRKQFGGGVNLPIEDNGGSYYSKPDGSTYFVEFDENNNIVWSTPFGAPSYQSFLSDISIDNNDDIIIVGTIFETGLNDLSEYDLSDNGGLGYLQTDVNFSSQGIILKLSGSNRDIIWSTFYGDDETIDEIHGVTTNSDNDIIIVGTSRRNTAYLGTPFPLLNSNAAPNTYFEGDFNATASNTNSNSDNFIGKFSSVGAREHVTLFGGQKSEGFSPKVKVDGSDNIYVSTHSNSLATTSGTPGIDIYNLSGTYFQENLNQPDNSSNPIDDNTFDAFLFVLDPLLQPLWGTFIGGNGGGNGDFGRDITILDNQYLFLAGESTSAAPLFPTEDLGNGAWFENQSAGGLDLFISRFRTANVIPSSNEEFFEMANSINLYPNPTGDILNIDLSHPSLDRKENIIEVYNIWGVLMMHSKTNSSLFEIDMSQYPAATYVVTITNHRGIVSKTVIKK